MSVFVAFRAVDDCSVKLFLALRDSVLDEARRVAVHSADSSDDLNKALDILDRIDGGQPYSCVEEEDVEGCMSGHVWEEDDQLCQVRQNYSSYQMVGFGKTDSSEWYQGSWALQAATCCC